MGVLTPAQAALVTQLFDIGAIKFGRFRLKLHERHPEAPLSPLYIDLRVVRRFPAVKRAAVDVYEELLRGLRFDLLADVPMAATPFVASLSDRLQTGQITPRLDQKTHGSGARVDGLLERDRGARAALIDDLVTKADSKIEAALVLKEEGVAVNDIVVLIDREQGGRQQLAGAGYHLHAAMTMGQILRFYLESGQIDGARYHQIVEGVEQLTAFETANR